MYKIGVIIIGFGVILEAESHNKVTGAQEVIRLCKRSRFSHLLEAPIHVLKEVFKGMKSVNK
jgi:hypothetical protein